MNNLNGIETLYIEVMHKFIHDQQIDRCDFQLQRDQDRFRFDFSQNDDKRA